MKALLRYLILHPLAFIVGLVALLLLSLFLLLFTQAGTQALAKMSQHFLPELRIEEVSGVVGQQLQFKHLSWDNNQVQVNIKDAKLDSKLSLQDMRFKELELGLLQIRVSKGEGGSPVTIPDIILPFHFQAPSARVKRFELWVGDTLTAFNDVSLSAYTRGTALVLDEIHLKPEWWEGDTRLSGKGELNLVGEHTVKLNATLESPQSVLGAGKLDGEFTGTLKSYDIVLDGHWQYENYPQYSVDASGQGTLEQITASSLLLSGDAGQAEATGLVKWGDKVTIEADVDASEVDLTYFDEQTAGLLDSKLHVSGILSQQDRWDIQVKQLEGFLHEYPVKASGKLQFREGRLNIKQVDAAVGNNTLKAQGEADDRIALTWTVNAKKLEELHPDLKGSVTGSGRYDGLLDAQQLAIQINKLSGNVHGYPVKATGRLAKQGEALSADDVAITVGKNHLTLSGGAKDRLGLVWQLNAKKLSQLSPKLKGRLKGKGELSGLLDASRLNLNIQTLSGQFQGYPVKAKGRVQLKDQSFSSRDLVVDVGQNRVTLNGSTADDSVGVDWSLNARNLKQLSPELSGRLKGEGNLKGLLDGSKLDLTVNQLSGKVKQYPINAKGKIKLDHERVRAQNFSVRVGRNQILLNGDAESAEGLSWSLDAKRLAGLVPELKGQVKGSGTLKGLLDGSRLDINIARLTGKAQGYPVSGRGLVRFKDKKFSAQDLLLSVGKNQVVLNGEASDRLGVRWRLDAKDLRALSPELQGHAKGRGTLSGALDGSQLALSIQNLSGSLKGYPLNAKGEVFKKGKRLEAKNLRVNLGQNLAVINGQMSEPFSATWQVDAKQLSQVYKGLAGQLKGRGSLKGTLKQPIIFGDLSGANLRYQDNAVQQLTASIQQRSGKYTLSARAKGVKQGNTLLPEVKLDGHGTVARHSLTAFVNHPDAKLDIQASGGWVNKRWQGTVHKLVANETSAGRWQLVRPMQVSWSEKRTQLGEACLTNNQGLVCVTPQFQGDTTVLTGRMQRMPLSILRSALPPSVSISGVANADFQLQLKGKHRSGRFTIQLPDNVIQIQRSNGKPEVLRYSGVVVRGHLQGNTISLQGQAAIHGRGNAKLDGRIMLADNGQHRLDVRTVVTASSIAWLQAYIPQIDGLKGRISGDIVAQGLLNKPQLIGQVRLQGGHVYVPETGVSFRDINLTIKGAGHQQLSVTGSLNAGGGLLKANGVLRLGRLPHWDADVRLQGNNLLIMDTHEVRSWVSPNLNVKASAQAVSITGRVHVPKTIISLRELPRTAKVRSDDVVIVGRRAKQYQQPLAKGARLTGKGRPRLHEPERPLKITPNVTVDLGNDVQFSGFGVEAFLKGRMRILRAQNNIIGEGSLNVVEGVYRAYGQRLTIERGRLIFTGAIDNPGIDLRAVRTVENGDIRVGIALGGTVQHPESSLFSSPVQRQSDTLSYLLTGRSVTTLSGSETVLLQQAITSLGIAGGEGLAQQLGSAIGLDEVGLTSRNGDYRNSELLLGKRLGPRLYVKYIVGLFESLQRVALTYKVNRHVELEAQSGEHHGVDLIYKIDTNRGPLH